MNREHVKGSWKISFASIHRMENPLSVSSFILHFPSCFLLRLSFYNHPSCVHLRNPLCLLVYAKICLCTIPLSVASSIFLSFLSPVMNFLSFASPWNILNPLRPLTPQRFVSHNSESSPAPMSSSQGQLISSSSNHEYSLLSFFSVPSTHRRSPTPFFGGRRRPRRCLSSEPALPGYSRRSMAEV